MASGKMGVVGIQRQMKDWTQEGKGTIALL